MMRIGQVRLRGVAAMAGLANDTAVKPRRRLHRARGAKRSAATRVSPCAVRKPGQAGWRDRQALSSATLLPLPRKSSERQGAHVGSIPGGQKRALLVAADHNSCSANSRSPAITSQTEGGLKAPSGPKGTPQESHVSMC
jgi:hypothetical protein